MRILFCFALLVNSLNVFSQRSDTTWWNRPWLVQSITTHNRDHIQVDCWHRNGRPMASGKFTIRSGYAPLTDILIVDSNGNKVQEYIYRRGELINYLPGGIVKDVLSAPLRDTGARYIEYYTHGGIKTRSVARKDTGSNGIFFFLPHYSREIAYMYQQVVGFTFRREEFYPHGSMYSTMVYRNENGSWRYDYTWYKLNGEIDKEAGWTNTNGTGWVKQGRRLEWWNNSNLKLEEYYKDNQPDRLRRTWHENGQIAYEIFFRDGKNDSIFRMWYPNGQLQRYSDYRFGYNGSPTMSFFQNGMVETQETAIFSRYDSMGRLLYESFSAGMYNRSFDFRAVDPSGNVIDKADIKKTNFNRYVGDFDRLRQGKWVAYDALGRLMYSTFYLDGLTEGETLIYDTMGVLRAKNFYHRGRLDGPSLILNGNGTDTVEYGNYANSHKFGIWRTFHPNGQLRDIKKYGPKQYEYEEIVRYSDKGRPLLVTEYDPAKKQRVQHHYYEGTGGLMQTVIIHDGRKEMDSYYYHPNGKLRSSIVYQQDGTTVEEYWFDNGKQEMTVNRRNGKAFGLMTQWFCNGKKRYEGVMKEGIRDGHWTYYNEDGSIASTPYFENGTEIVQRPEGDACFCNKTYPSFGSNSFFNSADAYMPLSTINKVMRRFQFDTTYKYAFVRCDYCWPRPIIAYRDINIKIGTGGMFLNLTPCRQGHNYGIVDIANFTYTHITNEYREYDDDSVLLSPPDLREVVARTIAIIEHRSDFPLYQSTLADLSGDTLFFHRFLSKAYHVQLPSRQLTEEEEAAAIEQAGEYYDEHRTDDSPSFQKDLGYRLANQVLQFFPDEATILQRRPTDRAAINKINGAIHQYITNEWQMEAIERLVYGSIQAELDSGSMSLNIPVSFISACDPVTGKPLLKNGKPSSVSFFLSYKEAKYDSYPSDQIELSGVYNACAPAFAIKKTGAWIKPDDFEFVLASLKNQFDAYHGDAINPYNYPAHYSRLEMQSDTDPRKINADLDEYILNFMGVVVKQGELNLPGMSVTIPVIDVIIDDKEINGMVKLPNGSTSFSEEDLVKALRKAGFKAYLRHAEWNAGEDDQLIVYFNYKK